MFAGASLKFSKTNLKCDTLFTWTGASRNVFDAQIVKDGKTNDWIPTNQSQLRVNDTLFHKSIRINVRVYIQSRGEEPYSDSSWTYQGILCAISSWHISIYIWRSITDNHKSAILVWIPRKEEFNQCLVLKVINIDFDISFSSL